MTKKYFGTDGIRGAINSKNINGDMFFKFGLASGTYFKSQKKKKQTAIIAKDTRLSGYTLEPALVSGLASAGMHVYTLGPLPTNGLAMLTKSMKANMGIMITASHNQHYDNGLKLFGPDGMKLSDKIEKKIEKLIDKKIYNNLSSPEELGRVKRLESGTKDYIKILKKNFTKDFNLRGLRIVIDCANGATYHIAEDVFTELGASVSMINNSPDGYNINRDCGATDTKHLQKVVLENNADLGIAFDGDGDRLIMVDHKGHQVDGDELVFIIANAWKESGDLKSKTVVGTKMTNLGIQSAFADAGISFIEADVGDRHVMNELIKHKAVLGGEGSGHIICLNKSTSGDGIIAALQVLEVMSKTGKNLNDLKSRFTKYPQVLINVKTKLKVNLQGESKLTQAVNSIESKLSNTGRILIRESGTEPLIRVMVESANYKLAKDSAEELAEIIKTM